MHSLLLIPLILCGLVSPAFAADQALLALQQTNVLLQAELELGRAGNTYLLVDLPEQKMKLKANGLILKEWAISGYRRWGHPSALPAAKLVSKSSRDEPEREVQVVNSATPAPEAPSKQFEAFELEDMPNSYRLLLENGTEITVRQRSDQWLGRLWRGLATPLWYLSRPLISNWKFMHGSSYNELALLMSKQDARMLYWALKEGSPCLIRPPEAVAVSAPVPSGKSQ